MKMFAASVGSDSIPVNKNETIINNATAASPYPRSICLLMPQDLYSSCAN